MKSIFISLFLFISFYSFGQSYTYKQLELDTTCFWTYKFHSYFGFPYYDCHAQRITEIEKDSIIGSHKYFKLRTYTSEIYPSTPQIYCEFVFMKDDIIQFIREDTISRTIVDSSGNILLDFNGNVGDSIYMGLSNLNPIIDSITIETFNSIDRKVRWGHLTISSLVIKSIEGIGATLNFPPSLYTEWGTPGYELICFSKQGVKLYPTDSTTPCLKKIKVPVLVNNIQAENFKYTLANTNLQLLESPIYPVTFKLYDLTGRQVLERRFNSQSTIEIPHIGSGIYLLSIEYSRQKMIRKIYMN